MWHFLPMVMLLFITNCGQISLEDFSSMKRKYQFINLKASVDRKEKMEEQLKIAQVNFERLDAVWGKKIPKEELDLLVKEGVFDKNARNKKLSPGEIGIYLSTLNKSLPKAIANKDTITITFEDDTIIPYDVDVQLEQALKAVPKDWDILYLGCYQNYWTTLEGGVIGPFLPKSKETKDYKYPLCAVDESRRIYQTPWIQVDGGCVAGMYAYALRPESAQKLKKALIPIKQAVDRELTTLTGQGLIRAYCLNPELIRANTTVPSTIR